LKEKEKEKAKERRKLAALHRGHRKSNLRAVSGEAECRRRHSRQSSTYYDAAVFLPCGICPSDYLLFPDWLHIITPDGHLQGIDETKPTVLHVIQGPTLHSWMTRSCPS